MWLSILFSIMSLSPLHDTPSDTPSPNVGLHGPEALRPVYIEHVIQCLILGDYSCGGPYTIEALHHYFVLEHAGRREADARNWSLYGLILRLAFRMGYHRDPSNFPLITPFEGEIRRRLWMMLYCLDVMVSIQMGMPRLIKDEQCDTQLPRNISESDFNENMDQLPAPRSDVDVTPTLQWRGKYKMLAVMAKIADMSLSTAAEDPCSSSEIKRLETLLRTTYDQLPEVIKFTSLSNCLADSPEDTAHRVMLAAIMQKGIIILHRRHVVGKGCLEDKTLAARSKCGTTCTAESVRKCVDAAMQVLDYQNFIYSESRDSGALSPLRWRVLSSPISHEFLMATSVLCTYLHRVYKGDSEVAGIPKERIRAIEKALSRTHSIWQSQSSHSRDARRVTAILGRLVGKLQDHGDSSAPPNTTDTLSAYPTLTPQLGGEETMMYNDLYLYPGGLSWFGSIIQ